MTEEKRKVLNRLRRTEGQIHGIRKIIDEEKECIDATTQLSVVRSSIDYVMGAAAAEDLEHCFKSPEKDPKEQEERLVQTINMIVKK